MKESTLLRIAIIVSLIGLCLIYAVAESIEISDTTIEKITSGETEETVKITGNVVSVSRKGGATRLVLAETTEINAVVFSSDIELAPGDSVEIAGKISEYNGEKEIIADRIIIK